MPPTNAETNEALFEVSHIGELHALLRALLEAKFHVEPHDELVPVSPFVAHMSYRVVDALAQADKVGGDALRKWQRAETRHAELAKVRERLAYCRPWPAWSSEQKQKYVADLLAPFIGSPETVRSLVEYADHHNRAA